MGSSIHSPLEQSLQSSKDVLRPLTGLSVYCICVSLLNKIVPLRIGNKCAEIPCEISALYDYTDRWNAVWSKRIDAMIACCLQNQRIGSIVRVEPDNVAHKI